MTDMATSPRSGKRSVWRLAVAGLVTLFAGLVASGFWIVGQAQYINDYCSSTRAPQPEPTPPFYERGLDGRPAYMDGPYTVVCEYDERPTVEIFDPTVLIGALFLAAVVIFIGICAFYWAWGPKQPKEAGHSELT